MNNIGTRIRKYREEKGITQELMAMELDLTQSNYGRLEKDDRRLTAPKLLKIAEILKLSVALLFGEQVAKVINQNNNDNSNGYNVENLFQNNKDAYDALAKQYENQISMLKDEVSFLRSVINKTK